MLYYRLPLVPGGVLSCTKHHKRSARAQRVYKKRQVQSMYAIIETGGKQYKVQNGDVLFIEKLDAAEDSKVVFDKVVALHNDKELKIGSPFLKTAYVDAQVLKNGKGKKIRVFTYRPKKGSKRTMGHRQPYTKVQIEGIHARAPRAPKAEEPATEE